MAEPDTAHRKNDSGIGSTNMQHQEQNKASRTLYPRVFAVDLHDVDNEKFQDSRDAGFSWYVLITTLLVSLSVINIGWSFGIVNVSKPIICQLYPLGPANTHSGEFPNRIPFSDSAWTIAVGILSVGGFLGALVSGTISDSIGRRNALVVNNGLYVAGSVLMGTATTAVHFTLGRFVMGIGCGIASGVANTYIGEIAPFKWRGFYGSFFQMSIVLGLMFSQLAAMYITSGTQWRIVVALPGAFSLLQIALLPLRVESPSYLLKVHHINEARHALLTLRRGYDVAAEWQESLLSLDADEPRPHNHSYHSAQWSSSAHHSHNARANLVSASSGQHRSAVPVKEDSSATMKTKEHKVIDDAAAASSLTFAESMLVEPSRHVAGAWQTLCGRTREDLRHLMACCIVLMVLQQLSGISAILFSDSGVVMDIFDPYSPLSAPWACIVVCGTSLPAIFLCLVCVDRLGRRALLLGSLGGMAICSILISAGLFYGPNSLVMAAVFLCYFVFNMGVGIVPWFYISEAIPSYSLGAATVLCCSLYWVLSIVTGLMVPLIENMVPQWLFVVFGSFMLAGFFLVMLFVPETMDCSVSDVVKKHAGNIHLVVKIRRHKNSSSSTGGTSRSLLELLRC
ncbi:Bifunctional purine biosynthesis protein PurH [Coemansia sp. RSA 989]|nr:major facilitator superfamily domain-containing protein [Coemansia mojavensis]KAJ1868608.1 Bifunctional purine biosynthesis protein PurH [Coemansia sp. RSA 989]KAJ1876221.1 Bifunctional purine biosynthesis protein PurH [Coemansia sp. RSA 990]KAJ2633930.1 Bifunctional purine biosynthesis protein PurH [Coemansia sp. RSA 1290]KAJ2652268.1 Bifunctional purine biosynthesis protein PurH [Coemansia sp. RSA 1250]KAJ2675799.1 Bifunctional purine biosynthesis protein PurH [Coemansia sp. RSA 1085]